jgi:hypothetical protein
MGRAWRWDKILIEKSERRAQLQETWAYGRIL